MSQGLQKLVRPSKYAGGKRPSFQAAYARACRRYKFQPGMFPIVTFKDNAVFRVAFVDDIEKGTEITAESIQNDLEYVVPVTIGTPGKQMYLNFDTGSSDLWVWSSKIAGVESTGHRNVYDPDESSTARKVEGTWEIRYLDESSASGDVYLDTITIGDIAIQNQAVEVATVLSGQFLADEAVDGLLGLAWSQNNTVEPLPVDTPVKNMIDQKLIDPPVFTVKLERADVKIHDTDAGFYSFGYIDHNVTSDPILYTPVDNSKGHWFVPSASWSLNGQVIQRPGNTTVLDTGTTLALLDDAVVFQLYHAIEGAIFYKGWMFPAEAVLPEISLAVGNNLYKINPKDLPYQEAFPGYVWGSIQSRGTLKFDIFGDAFLKSVYLVFNSVDVTVGVAQRHD